jgi:hypothetical protein
MSEHFIIGPCSHGVVGGCRRDDGPPCVRCRGRGFIGRIEGGYYGDYPDGEKCPDCKGTGVRL